MAYAWLLDDELNGQYYLDETIMERYALSVFYYSMNGDNWLYNDGWLTSSETCDWYGVTCNAYGIELDLGMYDGISSSFCAKMKC